MMQIKEKICSNMPASNDLESNEYVENVEI